MLLLFTLASGIRPLSPNQLRAVVAFHWRNSTNQKTHEPMLRTWIIGSALGLALATPAVAQQQHLPDVLARLHTLCDQDYKPACIKLGFVMARLPALAARKLRRDHPEWWWWERW
jgi:hypothetical protein